MIETDEGLVVITGCAHPGVAEVFREARRLSKDDVHLVLGGFQLCWLNDLQVSLLSFCQVPLQWSGE